MDNVRIRSAILAFLFGEFGVDMLLLGPHQKKLFLGLGGVFWVSIVILVFLGATNAIGWFYLIIVPGFFLGFWRWARFFEYLSLTDQEFDARIAESNHLEATAGRIPLPE